MSSSNLTRLRKYSTIMMWLIPMIAALSVLSPVLYWVANINVIWFGENNIVFADNPPLDDRRLVGIAAIIPALIIWLIALYRLFQMFTNFQAGAVFNLSTIKHLRAYAMLAGMTAIFTVLGSGPSRWAQGEFNNYVLGSHTQISDEQWLLVFTAAIFYFVSFALEWAKEYKEEAESYI